MASANWRTIGETVGLLAIVASLIFVGFELQQDQTLARSELASDGFNRMSDIAESLTDPEFATIYAKMLEQPEQLTRTEMIQVNAFLTLVTDLMARECYLAQRGVYVECDYLMRDSIRRYFGNAYAQNWWRVADTRPNVELPEWVDEEISNASSDAELRRLDSIRQELGKDKK
ncbi:MAG: hypothetical protein HKN50_10410 [Gammaproteobacteria bacterium]|nr:hypothetical protein [Gammaproteobacteria bacterium]